jgi:hypothetical protein
MRAAFVPVILAWLILSSCSSNTRSDIVPDTFTVRNKTAYPIAAFVRSSRTSGAGIFEPTITDEAFAANRIEAGQDKSGISVPDFIGQDSAYLIVYRNQDGLNVLVHSRLFNQIALIRNKKLLVFEGP